MMDYNTSMTIVEQTTMSNTESENNNTVAVIIISTVFGIVGTCFVIGICVVKYFCPDERWDYIRRRLQCKCCNVESQTNGQSEMETVRLLSDSEKIERYLCEKQKIFCHEASRFTPAILNSGQQFDLTDIFTELDLLNENDRQLVPTKFDEVLANIKSIPACKVLIDGDGGIGKSTLLRYIAYRTAKENIFEGKIVFPLNARDLEKDDSIVDLIVKQPNMNDFEDATQLSIQKLRSFIVQHDGQIVLLIDGLDELRFENKSVIHLFRKNALVNSLVILTSRSENIDYFKNACNVHVRVNGFGENSIKKYIENHFEYLKKPEFGKSLVDTLFGDLAFYHFNTINQLQQMCKNPMLLLSICIMWENKQRLPSSKSDLFKEIFRSVLNQFIEKQPQPRLISKFEDTPKHYVYAMIILGNCMYQSLKVNQLSINKKDLLAETTMVDMALKLGFFYKDAPILRSDFEEIYIPSHKLIAESLAGFYLYKVVVESKCVNECTAVDINKLLAPLDKSELKEIFESEHFRMTREFAIGFLGGDAVKVIKLFIKHDLLTYQSLGACLECVDKHNMDAVIEAISQLIEIQQLTKHVSNSLKMFIQFANSCLKCQLFQQTNESVKMLWEVYSKYVLFPLNDENIHEFIDLFPSGRKGQALAHIICIGKRNELKINNYKLSFDVLNAMIREYLEIRCKFKYIIISGNSLSNIDGRLLGSLLKISSELISLDIHNCNLSSDAVIPFINDCSRTEGMSFTHLNISYNNLGGIDGTLLYTLPTMSPKLEGLYMQDCNLSGNVMNAIIKCLGREVILSLTHLCISNNDLCDIDGILLGSLLTMSPKLKKLYMHKCNLSGDVINKMITVCSERILSFTHLDISNNKFGDTNGTLLVRLLNISPHLQCLCIDGCNLSDDEMNAIKDFSSVELKTYELFKFGKRLDQMLYWQNGYPMF